MNSLHLQPRTATAADRTAAAIALALLLDIKSPIPVSYEEKEKNSTKYYDKKFPKKFLKYPHYISMVERIEL